jgi:hypothetical protein
VRALVSNDIGTVDLFYDDGYYYFQIARQIVEGNGSTWDGIDTTNGYHPLWMVVLLPVFAVVRDRIAVLVAVKLLQGLLWIGAMLFLGRVANRIGAARWMWIGALPIALYCAVYGRAIPFGGVETALLLLLVLAVFDRAVVLVGEDDPERRIRLEWATGALVALVVLARIDAAVLAAFLVAWLAWRALPDGIGAAARRAVRLALPLAASLTVYLAFNQLVFGTALTTSSRAKAIGGGGANSKALESFFREPGSMPILLGPGLVAAVALVVVAGLVALARRRRPDSSVRGLAELTALLAVTWTAGLTTTVVLDLQSGWPLWPWYHYHSFLVLLLAPGVGLAALVVLFAPADERVGRGRSAARAAVALAVASVVAGVLGVLLATDATGSESFLAQNAKAASTLRRDLPDDAVIAMGDRAGVVGYLVDRPVVQLEGIVNSADYLEVLEHGDIYEYLAEVGVDHLALSRHTPDTDDAVTDEPGDCRAWDEPFFAPEPSVTFIRCTEHLVYRSPVAAGEQFALWRFDPSED